MPSPKAQGRSSKGRVAVAAGRGSVAGGRGSVAGTGSKSVAKAKPRQSISANVKAGLMGPAGEKTQPISEASSKGAKSQAAKEKTVSPEPSNASAKAKASAGGKTNLKSESKKFKNLHC